MSKNKPNNIRKVLKTLKQYREDKNDFINACTIDAWKSWANSAHFWFCWSAANITDPELTKDVVNTLLTNSAISKKYADAYWIILSVYTDPDKWIGDMENNEYTLPNMLKKYGQPA